jgi:hypothetical protein
LYHQYQQTSNSPCVIGENSCNNPAGFSYTLGTGGGVTSYDLTSPAYLVSQITGIVGSYFFVGLDINQSDVAQTLQAFTITVNGTTIIYNLPDAQSVPALSNGTGYADYWLAGPNGVAFSIAGLTATDTITFHAIMDPANAGGEQFFLLQAQGPITSPEPGSLTLLSAGLIGLGGLVRRRK